MSFMLVCLSMRKGDKRNVLFGKYLYKPFYTCSDLLLSNKFFHTLYAQNKN